MAFSLFLNLFFLELGPHKEFRFIQNAIPGRISLVVHPYTGQSISSIGRVPIEILPGKRNIT